MFVGYLGCIILFMGLYYNNVFNAQNFPFLAQQLLNSSSNFTDFIPYNQTLILTPDFTIDYNELAVQGTPSLTGSYLGYLITSNMGFTATFVHMLLWNFDDLKQGWSWARPSYLRRFFTREGLRFWANQETPEERNERLRKDTKLDPHYRLMIGNFYKEVPLWWWGTVLVICWAVALGALYALNSTLPWWGFLLSTIMMTIFLLFFGAQYGMTGFQYNIQPICQTLAGYIFPGRPLASKSDNAHGVVMASNSCRYVLYLLCVQLHATGPVTLPRSQAGAVRPLATAAHLCDSDSWLSHWGGYELGHDDHVRLGILLAGTLIS